MGPKILSVSASAALLRTRHQILQDAGYDVVSVIERKAMEMACQSQPFDLVILGHSLTLSSKSDAAKFVRERYPQTRILEIYASVPMLGSGAAKFQARSPLDPRELLSAVTDALA